MVAVTSQCLWRCHAAEHNHGTKFRATWRVHELDSAPSGHHSTHPIAKSLGRLARRTTRGSLSSASKKPVWPPPRQVSKSSLMDASHVTAGCAELSGHATAGAGDTLDIDEPVSPYPTSSGEGMTTSQFEHISFVTLVTGRDVATWCGVMLCSCPASYSYILTLCTAPSVQWVLKLPGYF